MTRSSGKASAPGQLSARSFRALGSPFRMDICWLLSQGERSLSDLAAELGISKPLAAHHLGTMRAANLVRSRRAGPWTYYRLNPKLFETLSEELRSLAESPHRPAP